MMIYMYNNLYKWSSMSLCMIFTVCYHALQSVNIISQPVGRSGGALYIMHTPHQARL